MKAATSPQDVRLVIADVDGTLLTPDKLLTPRGRGAVRAVMKAGLIQ
jgi:hydroxymethylpyrimidine pyrophosphatase-like HAD family hydrolase